jgi:DNA-binding NarL/FixJ family response regulator
MIADSPRFTLAGGVTHHEAAERVAAIGDDLVVLDLSLEGVKGFELLSTIHAGNGVTGILALSPYMDAALAARALQVGAHGFLTYHEDAGSLTAALERLSAKQRHVPAPIHDRVLDRLVQGSAEPHSPRDRATRARAPADRMSSGAELRGEVGQEIALLSDREMQVYHFLGQGYSSGRIAASLSISDKTVHAHRESIKRKLGLTTAAELVHSATLWVSRLRRNAV